jgi:cell division protein FtsN
MVNYERSVYEPSDEVRVFDGSEEEDDVEGSRLPLLIVLALIVLFAFGGVVYFAYSQGVARGRGETPVLTAAAGPDRVAPQSPGGSNVPYQGFKIYEQPAPSDDQADVTADPPAAPPAQVAQNVAAPQVEAKPTPVKPAAPVEKPVAMSPAPAKPAPKVAAAPAAPSIATGEPRKLGAALAPAPAPAAKAPSPPVAATAPAQAAPAAASGAYVLQIGAYKSQAEADAAWRTYQGKHAALLLGFTQNVQQADLGAKGTWYRLRITGFAGKDGAVALCDRLKADGGACFLGK